MLGSNQRPRDYESPALTAELMALRTAYFTKNDQLFLSATQSETKRFSLET